MYDPLQTFTFAQRLGPVVGLLFAGIALLYLLLHHKKIGFSYWLMGMCSILVPLAGPPSDLWALPRFIAVVFPLYIILAKIGTIAPRIDRITVPVLSVLQVVMMVLWTTGTSIPL